MDPEFQRHDAQSAKAILTELVDVYATVYDTPPTSVTPSSPSTPSGADSRLPSTPKASRR